MSFALGVYCIARQLPTQVTLVSLVYRVVALAPAAIVVSSGRLALVNKISDHDGRSYDAKTLEEKQLEAKRP